VVLSEVLQEIYEGRPYDRRDDAAIKELVRKYDDLLDEKERLEKLIDGFLNLR